jgi:pilus assembly protein CpaF
MCLKSGLMLRVRKFGYWIKRVFDFYYQIGTHRRKLFQAVGSHCSIGSARSNDLVIDSRQLSKRQAELRLEDSGVYIRDLGSLTGCWVNRERVVERGPLSDLDEIEVGDVRVTLKAIRVPLTAKSKNGSIEASQEKPSNTDQHVTVQSVLQPSENEPSQEHPKMPSPHDEALAYWGRIVHEQLLFQMDLQRKDVNRMSDESLRRESLELIKNIVAGLDDQLPDSVDREQLINNVLNESVGLGPLEEFLQDESITEIMVNNYREIFIERNGKLEQSRVTFSSDATVSAVIDRIISPLGRRIDESSPIVDARLKDGSRVNAIVPPLALKGPCLTIRKFPKTRLKFSDLVASDAISQSMVDFLKVCVEMRKNIIVSGGTGSGKTTLLNVLSNFIPATDRIVTIEDAAELKLAQPNLVSLESRPPNLEGRGEIPIRDLVRNSLRMRPDRIVVGECRGGEALDMLQAMNTGHNGSLTTIHANNPRDVLSRLEVLVLMAGMELPISAIREQVASAVDLIIQQTRFPCGARKITKITEVVGVESGTVQLQEIFTYGQRGVDDQGLVKGNFVATGAIPTFYEELRNLGYEVDLSSFSSATERAHS